MPVHTAIPARGQKDATASRSAALALLTVVDGLLGWHERARQRRALLALDERLLKDIGVTRAEAEAEGRRPFWRAGDCR